MQTLRTTCVSRRAIYAARVRMLMRILMLRRTPAQTQTRALLRTHMRMVTLMRVRMRTDMRACACLLMLMVMRVRLLMRTRARTQMPTWMRTRARVGRSHARLRAPLLDHTAGKRPGNNGVAHQTSAMRNMATTATTGICMNIPIATIATIILLVARHYHYRLQHGQRQ